MIKILPLFLFACSDPTEYDKHLDKWSSNSTWTEAAQIKLQDHTIDVTFHGSNRTVREDIKHVQLASMQFLATHSQEKIEKCVDRMHDIDIFHVPCSLLNDDRVAGELKDYPYNDGKVYVGLTYSEKRGSDWERSSWDFAVGYCYDDMVKLSAKVNYETDTWWRELALAHEMTHIWQRACDPVRSVLSPGKEEKVAFQFHEKYKETAKKLHVDY
jgi:hypothetical protein